MLDGLIEDISTSHPDRSIRSLVVKMKFADFDRTTAERASHRIDPVVFEELLAEAWRRGNNRAVRLLGVGVRFDDPKEVRQLDFFA
jgi:DNA polymerase-4